MGCMRKEAATATDSAEKEEEEEEVLQPGKTSACALIVEF